VYEEGSKKCFSVFRVTAKVVNAVKCALNKAFQYTRGVGGMRRNIQMEVLRLLIKGGDELSVG